MNINDLQMRKARLSNQLFDLNREKEEIQTALSQVESEIEVLSGPNSEQQIWDKGKEIDYDTKIYTLEHVISYHKGRDIECILPTTMWDASKQSKFIESFLLGLPLILYMADIECVNPYLQIVDGNQRVLALSAFIRDELQLANLEVLDTLNGLYFKDLIPSRQRKFLNTSIRVIIFSNTTEKLRKDLTNRFNMNYKTNNELNDDSFQLIRNEYDSLQLSLSEFLQTEDGQRIYKAGYRAMELSFYEGHPYPGTSYPSESLEYEAFHYGVRDAFTVLGGLGKTQE